MPKAAKKAAKKTKTTNKPDERWFVKRMDELGLGKQDAARHFGTYTNMLWRVMSGARPVRVGEVIEWAKFLKVPVSVVLVRFGFDVPRVTVPVVGVMRKTGRVSVLPPNQQTRVDAPDDLSAAMVAIRVEGAHSALAIFEGSYLFYEPSNIVRADSYGRLSVVEFGDYPAPLVGVVDRADVGRGRVTLFGGLDTIESEMMISATPVLWTRA
jgi:hypothetical protein